MTTAQLEYFEKECKEDFKTIKASLDAFNIFEVLKIHRREIRHSNFLGWLFDPNGSHNLGDIFLKELIKLLNKGEKYQINVLDKSLNNTIVFRESKGNIDVLIINETLGFSICIENKIGARFSKTQLEKYYKYVHRNYDHLTNKVFITLTPSLSVENFSTEEEIDIYQNITYKNLINAFENLGPDIEKAKVSVADSIKQYIAVHKKHIVKNSEELLLARKLYLKYKGEIDYIIASRPDFRKKVKDVEKAFKDDFVDGLEILPEWKPKHIFRILPKNENLKKLYYFPQAKAWNGDYIFAIELFLNKEVYFVIFVLQSVANQLLIINRTHLEDLTPN